MECLDYLRLVSPLVGVSGYEGEVALSIAEAWQPFLDECQPDRLGNVIGIKYGTATEPRPRIMLVAHTDEIGLVITKIEKGGFLRFTTSGGIDPRTLLGQEVIVNASPPLPGIIGARPPHLQNAGEQQRAPKVEDMFIDTGKDEDQVRKLVHIGDMATVDRNLLTLQNGVVAGKALDDRAGTAAILECLKELRRIKHQPDVYAVASVQEELGYRGAVVSSFRIHPDLAIAIDVCHGNMPGTAEEDTAKLGKGPALGIGPHVHPTLLTWLKRTAEDRGIPWQPDPSPSPEGTDAFALQIARGGVPTALVSIPLRYMHTSVETLSLTDIRKTGQLLADFIATVAPVCKEELVCF